MRCFFTPGSLSSFRHSKKKKKKNRLLAYFLFFSSCSSTLLYSIFFLSSPRVFFSRFFFSRLAYYVTRRKEQSEELREGRNSEVNEERGGGDEISRQVDNPYAHSSGVERERRLAKVPRLYKEGPPCRGRSDAQKCFDPQSVFEDSRQRRTIGQSPI